MSCRGCLTAKVKSVRQSEPQKEVLHHRRATDLINPEQFDGLCSMIRYEYSLVHERSTLLDCRWLRDLKFQIVLCAVCCMLMLYECNYVGIRISILNRQKHRN